MKRSEVAALAESLRCSRLWWVGGSDIMAQIIKETGECLTQLNPKFNLRSFEDACIPSGREVVFITLNRLHNGGTLGHNFEVGE